MRNRAKCKLCNKVLESFHENDWVECECSEISITGGKQKFKASAKHWENFIRIDDDDHEIPVKVVDNEEEPKEEVEGYKPTQEELYEMLVQLKKNIEEMPENFKTTSINHYDFYSLIWILSELLHPK